MMPQYGSVVDIVVTVKQVPDPDVPSKEFRIDEATRTLVEPAGLVRVMNGYDANALEEALRLRQRHGGTVTVVTCGPERARDAVRYALAMGADHGVHVVDPGLDGGDSVATVRLLAAAIRDLGRFDLILSGRQASDTDGGQVHLGVAALLGLPAISPVRAIASVEGDAVVVHRATETGHQRLRVALPAMLGISSEINEPRSPPVARLLTARKLPVTVRTADELGVGRAAPPVRVRRLYTRTNHSDLELVVDPSPARAGALLADRLHTEGLL